MRLGGGGGDGFSGSLFSVTASPLAAGDSGEARPLLTMRHTVRASCSVLSCFVSLRFLARNPTRVGVTRGKEGAALIRLAHASVAGVNYPASLQGCNLKTRMQLTW